MRISYLIHQFSPKHTSSVEQYCFNLAREMKARGNEVSIFMYQYSNQNAKLQKGTINTTMDGMLLREVYHNYQMLKDADKYEYYNPVIKQYAKEYFAEFKPDIVHIMHLKNLSVSVIDAAYDNNIPVIFTPTDFWLLCPNFTLLRADYELCRGPFTTTPCQICLSGSEDSLGQKIADRKHQPLSVKLKSKLKESFVTSMTKKVMDSLTSSMHVQKQWVGIDAQLERKEFILRKCEKIKKILAPSQFMKDVLIENGYDKSQIDVLPLGFELPVPKEIIGRASEKLRIGYIGTINKHKGTHLLIEAMKGIKSKNVELTIYGDFTRFHKYTHHVKNLAAHDRRISFKGTFKPDKIDEIFQGIDILCVPSLWYENIPTIIYSALQHRTPVLAPAFGSIPEIIHHTQNGILFRRNDVDDLRDKISDILEDMSIIDRFTERIAPPKTIYEHADELLTEFEKHTYCDKT
jgi:glycosyltransferase involved in cell wall biosynthesis